ncbi:hypothetical protein B0H11DRAFT_2229694 [Mycena galericulata]|nr:hypothetical protein B0H11DRAFT_2229694 [Mycena galericulata]
MAFTSSQHPAERPQILRQDLQGASAIPDELHRRSLGASALSMACLVPHVLRSPVGRFYMSSILFQRSLDRQHSQPLLQPQPTPSCSMIVQTRTHHAGVHQYTPTPDGSSR